MLKENISSLNKTTFLAALEIKNKLSEGLNVDLTVSNNKLTEISQKIDQIPTTDLTGIGQQLTIIQTQLSDLENQLVSQPSNGLTFTAITLQPTYQAFASNGWAIEPQNLVSLYDNDLSTASNLFQPNGPTYQYGQIEAFPGVTIPNFSRIAFKVGIRNSAGMRAYWELGAYNVSLASYVNNWSYFGAASNTSDLICNIDVIIPFTWDKLRWKMLDIGEYHPQARFYDLKVWEVS